VAQGGAKGATFPRKTVQMGECKGKQYPAFSAIVNTTTGEDLTEEEHAQLLRQRENGGNKKKSKK